jgi:hypothetical protein
MPPRKKTTVRHRCLRSRECACDVCKCDACHVTRDSLANLRRQVLLLVCVCCGKGLNFGTWFTPPPLSLSLPPNVAKAKAEKVEAPKKRGRDVDDEEEQAPSSKKGTTVKEAPAAEAPKTGLWAKAAEAKAGWQCSACMVDNEEGVLKCVACETPKAKGDADAAKAAAATAAKTAAAAKKAAAPSSDAPKSGLWAKFAETTAGWQCESCMVDNQEGVAKCVACETPNPAAKGKSKGGGAKPVAAAASGFGFGVPAAGAAAGGGATFGFGVGAGVRACAGLRVEGGGLHGAGVCHRPIPLPHPPHSDLPPPLTSFHPA